MPRDRCREFEGRCRRCGTPLSNGIFEEYNSTVEVEATEAEETEAEHEQAEPADVAAEQELAREAAEPPEGDFTDRSTE